MRRGSAVEVQFGSGTWSRGTGMDLGKSAVVMLLQGRRRRQRGRRRWRRWCGGAARAQECGVDEWWRRGGDVGAGRWDAALGHGAMRLYGGPQRIKKGNGIGVSEPTRLQLIGRSDGNDRTLPPGVRLTTERSKTSQIVIGHVRSLLTRHSQSPVNP